MRTIYTLLLTLSFGLNSILAQDIPPHRRTSWVNAGLDQTFYYSKTVVLTDFNADTTGASSNDLALETAIQSLDGPGRILFPPGKYLFLQSISLPDSIVMEGTTDPLTNSPISYLLCSPGNNKDGIQLVGKEVDSGFKPSSPPVQGDAFILLEPFHSFIIGDIIRLHAMDDSLLVNNSWAYHTTGQITSITAIVEDTLFLEQPLRRSYDPKLLPHIYHVIPRQQVHIKCFQIERLDSTLSQSANISFTHARNCSVRGVSSALCNFAHIDIRSSSRITVDYSFFTNAFNFGGGGKAYGVVLQAGSSSCYIHANNFKQLRHSILLQSGANGNVIAYNHSTTPYWTGTFLPADAAGDVVLHGNYPYMNLFEGNMVQNIVIDNSHGMNGPYNTFFRNRAALYGIFMNTGPASNQQNFIGNQVTNTASPFYGLFSLQGLDHYVFGNMVKGSIQPNGTNEPTNLTLFDYPFNSYYENITQIPPLQVDNWTSSDPLIEAAHRALTLTPTPAICELPSYEISSPIKTFFPDEWHVYPNPVQHELFVRNPSTLTKQPLVFKLYNIAGIEVMGGIIPAMDGRLNVEHLAPGYYWLAFEGPFQKRIPLVKIGY